MVDKCKGRNHITRMVVWIGAPDHAAWHCMHSPFYQLDHPWTACALPAGPEALDPR